jgi:hypothetical protein
VKESESLYTLWCSGRQCCEGMLVELKMIKRQDLVAIVAGLMKPTQDQLHIKVEISKDSMDTFVFAVGAKKTASKMFKELADLVSTTWNLDDCFCDSLNCVFFFIFTE